MKTINHIKGKFGEILMLAYSDKIIVAKPKGYISFSMIRKDFETVNNYDIKDFKYFVVLTNFVIPNPINMYFLSKLNSIRNLSSYCIITDNKFLKVILRLLKPVINYSSIENSHYFQNIKINKL